MKGKTYAEKLKDPRWQMKRLEILERAGFKCENPFCSNQETNPTVHVHHLVYMRGKMPWEYEPWAYMVLCEECHSLKQDEMERAHCALAQNTSLMTAIADLEKGGGKSPHAVKLFSQTMLLFCSYAPETFTAMQRALAVFVETVSDVHFLGVEWGRSSDERKGN